MAFVQVASSLFPDVAGNPPANFTDLCGGSGQIQVAAGATYHARFSGNPSDAVWGSAGSFTDNQYFQCTITGISGVSGDTDSIGGILRSSTDTGAGRDMYRVYLMDGSTAGVHVDKVVNGTSTQQGATDTSQTWANGDVLAAAISGNATSSTITVYRNGAQIFTRTDSSTALTGGKPGIYGSQNTLDAIRGSVWSGGNVTASTFQPSMLTLGVG